MTTFERDLSEVSLQPSATAGTFEIRVDGTVVWERKRDGGFPEAKVRCNCTPILKLFKVATSNRVLEKTPLNHVAAEDARVSGVTATAINCQMKISFCRIFLLLS